MTDFWVSNKKHYCDVCNCWIAGTTINIKNHESSARHVSSLRKKLIDSHRKQLDKKRQEDFEKEEISRLNSVTLDGPALAPHIADGGLTSSSLFTYSRELNPPVDKDREQARIAQQISRALAGAPMEDTDNRTKTTWMAVIDNDDGTLTYYNNVTGVKTKSRPRDFDGDLPLASSSLTSNWTLKFDPSKGAKYYHNATTGEIRWLEQPSSAATSASVATVKPPSAAAPGSCSRTEPKALQAPVIKTESDAPPPAASKPESQIKIKLESVERPGTSQPGAVPALKEEPSDSAPRPEDPYAPSHQPTLEDPKKPKEQYTTTVGQWEVVKPEESVFSHSIVSLEPYINPPKEPEREPDMLDVIREATYETPLLNVDDLQLQEKRKFDKESTTSEKPVQFVKRKLPKKSTPPGDK